MTTIKSAGYLCRRMCKSSALSLLLLFPVLCATSAFPSNLDAPASTSRTLVEVPVAAGAFADSVGMNIHLHYDTTLYSNFALVRKALQDLHIHHVRDGLISTTWQPYYDRHAALAASGIRGLFISGTTDTADSITSFSRRVAGAVEGLEAPNEFDRSGVANWSRLLDDYLPRLQHMAKSLRTANQPFVVGPSVTSINALNQVAAIRTFDFANMHNYFGGRHPGTAGWGDDGYGSIEWNLRMTRRTFGDKPVMTTETGYLTDPGVDQSVSEEVQSYYIPRVLLEQHLHGVKRTYLYELMDGSTETPRDQRSYGLVRKDGSLKPAFAALQRLMSTLDDDTAQNSLEPLTYSINPAPTAFHHVLLRKSDGTYLLAYWMEESSFDQVRHQRETTHIFNGAFHTENTYSASIISLDPKEPESTVLHPISGSVPITATAAVHILAVRLTGQARPVTPVRASSGSARK